MPEKNKESRLPREFIIYSDESTKRGRYYSNFYGGALVRSTDLQEVERYLRDRKKAENLFNEIKWGKLTVNYLPKYKAVVQAFFELIHADRVKVRIMFTNNQRLPIGLTDHQIRTEYHLLYYQFIKHAFGLAYSNPSNQLIGIRLGLPP